MGDLEKRYHPLFSSTPRARVLHGVNAERDAQDKKWGNQSHPDGTGRDGYVWMANQARQVCDDNHRLGKGTWADILKEEFYEALAESDPDKLRAELVQVAAVAVNWIEALDRREGGV